MKTIDHKKEREVVSLLVSTIKLMGEHTITLADKMLSQGQRIRQLELEVESLREMADRPTTVNHSRSRATGWQLR